MKKIILSLLLLLTVANAAYLNKGYAVVDLDRNLMWQDVEDKYGTNWFIAVSKCQDLNLSNYTDWRLPNFNELFILADRSRNKPAIDPEFKHTINGLYWSSTTVANVDNKAWYVDFNNGVGAYWTTKIEDSYVRCVRDYNKTADDAKEAAEKAAAQTIREAEAKINTDAAEVEAQKIRDDAQIEADKLTVDQDKRIKDITDQLALDQAGETDAVKEDLKRTADSAIAIIKTEPAYIDALAIIAAADLKAKAIIKVALAKADALIYQYPYVPAP